MPLKFEKKDNNIEVVLAKINFYSIGDYYRELSIITNNIIDRISYGDNYINMNDLLTITRNDVVGSELWKDLMAVQQIKFNEDVELFVDLSIIGDLFFTMRDLIISIVFIDSVENSGVHIDRLNIIGINRNCKLLDNFLSKITRNDYAFLKEISEITIKSCRVHERQFLRLIKCFSHLDQLQDIVLCNNKILYKANSSFTQSLFMLEKMPNISKLDLHNVAFKKPIEDVVLSLTKVFPNCKDLCLREVNIDPENIYKILLILDNWDNLEALDFSSNSLKGFIDNVLSFSVHKLKNINLSDNKLNRAENKYIYYSYEYDSLSSETIRLKNFWPNSDFSELKTINLSNCNLRSASLDLLSFLDYHGVNDIELILSHNNIRQHILNFFIKLSNCSSSMVTNLDLSENNIEEYLFRIFLEIDNKIIEIDLGNHFQNKEIGWFNINYIFKCLYMHGVNKVFLNTIYSYHEIDLTFMEYSKEIYQLVNNYNNQLAEGIFNLLQNNSICHIHDDITAEIISFLSLGLEYSIEVEL